jgi:dTDP-4-amino-4,6-dideoxygalactose transaminase
MRVRVLGMSINEDHRQTRTAGAPPPVPWSGNALQYRDLREEIAPEVERVLSSGKYVLNEDVAAFEEEFAAYCCVRYAVAVRSGSDAIAVLLRALGMRGEDEVVLPANSCSSEPNAILLGGGKPVPVDILESTYNLDPDQIEGAIGPRTRLIHAVHAYGQPCDMESINRIAGNHSLPVLEDIALAPGARINGERVGRFGDFAIASFGQGKILNAAGNGGGVLLTNDRDIAERARSFANYGGGVNPDPKHVRTTYLPPGRQRVWLEPGLNSSLDAIQAAILRVKLRHLDRFVEARAERARSYDLRLAGLDVITPLIADGVTSSYRGYIIRVQDRDRVLAHLQGSGVEAATMYLPPVHLQPAMARFGYSESDFPVTERVARELIVLPIYPELTEDQIEYVAQTLEEALAGRTT